MTNWVFVIVVGSSVRAAAVAAAVPVSLAAGAIRGGLSHGLTSALSHQAGSGAHARTKFKLVVAPVTLPPAASESSSHTGRRGCTNGSVAQWLALRVTGPRGISLRPLEVDNHAAVAIELHPPPLAGGERYGEPLSFNDVVCVPLVMVYAHCTVKADTKPR